MVAFNGTINNPPKKPNPKEQSINIALFCTSVKQKSETKIPNAPTGTIPSSMCNFDALPARYDPTIKPKPLTARMAWMITALSALNCAL